MTSPHPAPHPAPATTPGLPVAALVLGVLCLLASVVPVPALLVLPLLLLPGLVVGVLAVVTSRRDGKGAVLARVGLGLTLLAVVLTVVLRVV